MPAISKQDAVERLAKAVEQAAPDDLAVYYAELFPAKALPAGGPVASQLASHIRSGIEPEEVVDLWNVVFPADRVDYYDEEEDVLRIKEREERFAEQ